MEVVAEAARLDRRRLLEWVLAWCGLSAAWFLRDDHEDRARINLKVAALAAAGDHIVASSKLYGGTITQLDVSLRRFGVETTFVDSAEAADFEAALQPNTKTVYTEIVANPSGDVVDLPGLLGMLAGPIKAAIESQGPKLLQ